jgi:hypothetical protein
VARLGKGGLDPALELCTLIISNKNPDKFFLLFMLFFFFQPFPEATAWHKKQGPRRRENEKKKEYKYL